MTNRSAVDTIRGYFYQFDMSILALLDLKELDDTIEVECVEDIDVRTATDVTAIQCKYYEKTPYQHSVIKHAIMFMVSHFKDVRAGLRAKVAYTIRGHYASGQEKLDCGIDVPFLKENFLTYSEAKVTRYHHEELGLDDHALAEFLSLLTVDVRAKPFDDQYSEVISKIHAEFKCSPFAAEYYYYNNALRTIRGLAVKPDATDRRISKRTFLRSINTSNVLFNEWFVQQRGKKAHFAALRSEFFSSLNVSPFERFFLVHADAGTYSRHDTKDLIHILSRKWSKTTKRDTMPFCPYIYIHGLPAGELLEIKRELYSEGFKFIDGHDFLDSEFSADSVSRQADFSNGIRIKFLNTLENLRDAIGAIAKKREIYQFHLGNEYFDLDDNAVKQVSIQVEKFSDIKEII